MTFSSPDLETSLESDVRVWTAGPERPWHTVVAIAGPPTSSLLFRHLAAPLRQEGVALTLAEPFDPAPSGRADLQGLVERLAPVVPDGATVLVHGLALPIGFELLRRTGAAGLVVLDGPLERLDPVSAAAARSCRVAPALMQTLLRPAIAVPLLASSLGLRRAVVNPYAMDRDIVAMLTAPLIATRARRAAVVEYLGSISRIGPPWSVGGKRVLALWSSSDLLYPLPHDMSRLVADGELSAISMAGARFLSVEEQPWAVAASVVRWVREGSPTGDCDKDVVVSPRRAPTARGGEGKSRRSTWNRKKRAEDGTAPA